MKKCMLFMTLVFAAENILGMQNVDKAGVGSEQSNKISVLQKEKQFGDSDNTKERLKLIEMELRSVVDDLAKQYVGQSMFRKERYSEKELELLDDFYYTRDALRSLVDEIDTTKADCQPIFDMSIIEDAHGRIRLNRLKRFTLDPKDVSEIIYKKKYANTLGFSGFELICPSLKFVKIIGIPSKDRALRKVERDFVKNILLNSKSLESLEISKEWFELTKDMGLRRVERDFVRGLLLDSESPESFEMNKEWLEQTKPLYIFINNDDGEIVRRVFIKDEGAFIVRGIY